MTQSKTADAPKTGFKAKFGWAMFDFANSSYTTVIITVVYCNIFTGMVVGDQGGKDPDLGYGNLLWDTGLFISYMLCVITGPVFGAIMDFGAAKKKFLFMSYILTVVTTAAMFFVSPGVAWLGVVLLILSNFGFASGESFVASFLPSLGNKDELGKISGAAWGVGYLGGLLSVIATMTLGPRTIANFENLRMVGPITALFFLIAAIPTFLWVKEPGNPKTLAVGESYIGVGFKRLKQTLSEVKDFRDLAIFLVSLFFASAGLNIVITYAFRYGAQVIHWSEGTETIMFIVTQFTALIGALAFGYMQDKVGAKFTYNTTLVLWVTAILAIFLNSQIASVLGISPEKAFLIVGCLAGASLGATQSAGRAVVGILSPESKSGEFFGLWGLSGKLAAGIGVLGLGALQYKLGLQNAILFCAALFIIGLIIAIPVNLKRGEQAANQHEGE
ncbi:MAG: MFS transporter [Leptospirales bacterium]|nr:MFS transporter [Leptospirales bacterium]